MKSYNIIIMESDQAFKDLQALAAKEYKLNLYDFYTKYEKEINLIQKKYKLGWDELGSYLVDIKDNK